MVSFFLNMIRCSRLGLTSLCYLWQRDQKELLEEMITSGMDAILIKVAALGLDPIKHLGKSIKDCQNELMKLVKHRYIFCIIAAAETHNDIFIGENVWVKCVWRRRRV